MVNFTFVPIFHPGGVCAKVGNCNAPLLLCPSCPLLSVCLRLFWRQGERGGGALSAPHVTTPLAVPVAIPVVIPVPVCWSPGPVSLAFALFSGPLLPRPHRISGIIRPS